MIPYLGGTAPTGVVYYQAEAVKTSLLALDQGCLQGWPFFLS